MVGPLVIGDGRFMGLGLTMPSPVEKRQGADDLTEVYEDAERLNDVQEQDRDDEEDIEETGANLSSKQH